MLSVALSTTMYKMRLLFGIILIVFLFKPSTIFCLNLNIPNLYVPAWKGPSPDVATPIMVQHTMHLMQSYKSLLGHDLIDTNSVNDEDLARELFEADRYLFKNSDPFLCGKFEAYFNNCFTDLFLAMEFKMVKKGQC